MLSSRIPKHGALTGRSRCPRCGTQLGVFDLIPVVSFIYLGGRCRYCKERISLVYPLVELSTMLWFLYVFHYGSVLSSVPSQSTASLPIPYTPDGPYMSHVTFVTLQTVLNAAVGFLLIVTAGSDGLYQVIPNILLLSLLPLVLLAKFLSGKPSLINALLGGVLGFLFLYIPALIRPDALGGGDVKMAGIVGLYLGANQVFPGLALSFVLASVYALPLLILKIKKRTDPLPMGVFLSAGTLIWVMVSHYLPLPW